MIRKTMLCMILSMVAFSSITAKANVETEDDNTKTKMLFRDIPWGSTYRDVKNQLYEFDWYEMYSEYMQTYSVDDIIYGDYEGIKFDNSGFNMVSTPFTIKETNVAGYSTSDIMLYFAFPVTENGLEINTEDAIFYGATYEFKPKDYDNMYEDLRSKLASLYGVSIKTKKETDWLGIEETCNLWGVVGDVYISLRGKKVNDEESLSEDTITINYAWKDGDDLLEKASWQMEKEAIEKEAVAYGNKDTSGL